ncbi:MAG: hypothetical protein RLW61_17775 [Gammaproteobacteria bacterium]
MLLGECIDETGNVPTRIAKSELDESVTVAAIDARLEAAGHDDAITLRVTYLMFLVDLCARLSKVPATAVGSTTR